MNIKTLGVAVVAIGLLAVVVFLLVNRGPKHGMTIWPVEGGHPKLETNWRQIETDVLNRYPGLYYIQEYKNGDPAGPPAGTCDLLPLANLDRVNKKAKEIRYQGHAVQIGIGLSKAVEDTDCLDLANCPQDENPPPGIESRMPQAHYKQYINDSAEMVEAINCILKPEDCKGKK